MNEGVRKQTPNKGKEDTDQNEVTDVRRVKQISLLTEKVWEKMREDTSSQCRQENC